MNQSPAKPVRTALSALSKALVIEELMEHEDLDVRARVAVCINEIIRIFAPEPPYDDDKMKVQSPNSPLARCVFCITS